MTPQLLSALPSFTSTSSNLVAARSNDPRSRSARSRRIRAELYTGTTTDTLTGLVTRIFSRPLQGADAVGNQTVQVACPSSLRDSGHRNDGREFRLRCRFARRPQASHGWNVCWLAATLRRPHGDQLRWPTTWGRFA